MLYVDFENGMSSKQCEGGLHMIIHNITTTEKQRIKNRKSSTVLDLGGLK